MRKETAKEILLSLFLAWHSLVMIVGPMPGSYLKDRIAPLINRYRVLFYQDTAWDFFSPSASAAPMVRYQVKESSGEEHLFKLSEEASRSSVFLRYVKLYAEMSSPGRRPFLESVARRLCRKHADLKPAEVQIIVLSATVPPPSRYLEGRTLQDADLYKIRQRSTVQCGENF